MALSPPAPLFLRLAQIHRSEPIRHPQLRAVTFAQWMHHSALGASRLAQDHYNFADLPWRPEMAPHATRILRATRGRESAFCKFATLESFIAGYWAFLNRAPYTGWEEHVEDPQAFLRYIGPIYSRAPGYVEKVLALLEPARRLLEADPAKPQTPGPAPEPAPEPAPARGARLVDLGAIVIDPGHGGVAPVACSSPNNAISASGVKEKKLTLDFALVLRDEMRRQARAAGERVNVVLTRESDVNLACHQRAATAKACGARAFLSLHFNGARTNASGVETYVRATPGGLAASPHAPFARAVQAAILTGMRGFNPQVRDRGVKLDSDSKNGGIGVLNDRHLGNAARKPRTAAALAELEFITHPKVDALLVSGPHAVANRARLAQELASALRAYLRSGEGAA